MSFLTTLGGVTFHQHFLFFETDIYLEYQHTIDSRDEYLEPVLVLKYLFDIIPCLLTLLMPPRSYPAL